MIERISPVATRSGHAIAAPITTELIRAKADDARASERRRDIHILHTGNEDTLQRMLNALQPATYIAPHRHATPPKAEAIILLQGSLGFVPFTADGSPDTDNWLLLSAKQDCFGVDYRGGVWHTFFALEPDTVLFEVKPGPYDASADKEFAPWAPQEGDSGALKFLANLEDRFRSHFKLPPRSWTAE